MDGLLEGENHYPHGALIRWLLTYEKQTLIFCIIEMKDHWNLIIIMINFMYGMVGKRKTTTLSDDCVT